MPKITLTCQTCGLEYQRWPSKVLKGSRFCSRKCGEKWASRDEYIRHYQAENRVKIRERQREQMQDPDRKRAHSERGKARVRQLKTEAIIAYGGFICSCNHNGIPCGPHPLEFLAIDHINGEGKSANEQGGYRLYSRLKKDGYPSGFRVLCHNCNLSLGFFGYCPHSDTEKQSLWHHK